MNSSQDYTNAIFESMDILINKKIEQISFDSTIEATVIDASQASKGIYMVSNGSASFTATSTETGYKEKDIVLVTIPEGNYDNQKIIISKKPKDNADSPLIFRSPFENLIDVSNNIISGEYYVNMIANGGQEYGWDEGIDFKDSSAYSYIAQKDDSEQLLALVWDSEDLFEEGEFNHSYIGLKGQFSTWLNDYHTAGGNYGLAMEITFTHRDYVLAGDFLELNSTENQEENQAEKQNILKDRDTFSFSKIVCLDSSDFFGDIYNFETYYTQEATFDISEYSDFPITRIRLFAYQRNNFINKDQEKIYTEKDTEGFSTILPNIFIKDPYICFGQARDSFETDFANIITKQSLVYTKTLPKLPVLTESNSEKIPEDHRNIFIIDNNETSITKVLKPQIREKNSFFKLLKKVYLNKGYPRKRIVEVFNALVAANAYQPQDKEKTFINNSYLKWDNVGIIEKGYDEGRWGKKTGEKISNFGTYENNFKTIYDNQIKECKDVTLSNKEQTDYCFKTIEDILKDLLTYENRSLNNKKEIELRWIHKEDDSNLINAIQEGLLPPGYHIYWYYYKIGAPSPDEYMGAQWVRFYGCSENPDDSGNYCLTESEIQEDEDEATDHINVIFHPNVNKASEQLRAVIVKNELTNNSNEVLGRVIARSNILTFNNQSEVSSRATIIDTNALAIKIQDKEQGHYFLYNRAKQLFSTNENVLRQLTAVFDVDEDQVDNKKELEAPCVSIKWIVPAKDTMIEPVIVHKNNSQQLIRNVMANKSADEKVDVDDGIYSIEYDNSDKENYIFVQKDVTSEEDILKYMYYKIAKNLTYSNNRNTIYLEVNKDGQTYTASAQLLFGTAGTSGSDYTIVVDWEKGQGVLDIGQDEPTLSGQAYLIDQDGLRVDLDQDVEFQYEWYQVYCEKMQAKDRIEKEQITPTEDYFYPVNNQMLQKISMIVPSEAENGDIQLKNISLDVAYFANAADETGLQGNYSIIDGNGKLREDLYKYDITTHKYVKWFTKDSQVNANTSDDFQRYLWYAVSVAKDNEGSRGQRDKIEFIPFDFVTTEPGKISGDTNNYYGVITFDEDGKSTFHYDTRALKNTGDITYNGVIYRKGYKKAFIKDGDNFIIDPYDQYYSDLTYYYPQAISKSKTKEVGLVVQPINEEENKNNCKFLIEKDTESSDKLSINNLYTLQIKLTGFGDYNLIAHFPITLKNETSNSDIILDALEGATEVRYTTSGELDFNKTPYVLKMRYKDNDDNNWQAVNSNSGKFNEKFNGQWSLINSEQNQDFYLTNINKKQEDFVDELVGQWEKANFKFKKRQTDLEETSYTYWQLFNWGVFETASEQRTVASKSIILSRIKEIIANESFQTIASSVTDTGDENHCIFFLKGKAKNPVGQYQNLSRPGLNNKEFLSLITILIKYGWFDDSHVPFTSTTLSFPNVYFKNLGLCGIQFKVFSKSSTLSNEPLAVWTQPIYIYQDNYPSTTLNKWGGAEIVTDNDTGTILANGFSAGKKEKDNTFTGVVLGDWSKTDTDAVITKQTGIYGFNHGAMTYALKDDGTAFFGGDGGGRIYLNGTNATLYSANWIKSSAEPKTSLNGNLYQLESEGMKIDLASGKLLIQKNVIFQGITLTGGDFIDHRKIQLNPDGFIISRNHYEKSDADENKYKTINLFELKINNKDNADDVFEKISYALRTPDYLYNVTPNSGESPGAGMEINLGNKTITSFGKNVFQLGGHRHTSFWEGFQCLIQTADTPESSNRVLQIGQYYTNGNIVTPFFVEHGGHVHCNSLTIEHDLKIDDVKLKKCWIYINNNGKLQVSETTLEGFQGFVAYICSYVN